MDRETGLAETEALLVLLPPSPRVEEREPLALAASGSSLSPRRCCMRGRTSEEPAGNTNTASEGDDEVTRCTVRAPVRLEVVALITEDAGTVTGPCSSSREMEAEPRLKSTHSLE